MRKFNRQQPYTRTFGESPAGMVYFQDGLYFAANGDLTDCEHNRTVYASRGQSFANDIKGFIADPSPVADPVEATDPVVEPVDPLDGMAPAELFKVAERLRAQLDVAEDEDNYVPTLEATADNVAFIRRHTK